MDDLIKCCLHFTKESNVFTYRVKLSRYKFISKVINLLTPQSYKLKKARVRNSLHRDFSYT